MGIKQLYNDNLRKLPNEYGDVSVMVLYNVPISSQRLFIWQMKALFHKTFFSSRRGSIMNMMFNCCKYILFLLFLSF